MKFSTALIKKAVLWDKKIGYDTITNTKRAKENC